MLIITDNSKKLLKCSSIFIRGRKDREDQNKIYNYEVVGSVEGRLEVIKKFEKEEDAKGFIEQLALDMNANKRAKC